MRGWLGPAQTPLARSAFDLVVVAGSAGSFDSLVAILGGLPADFPLPIVVVRHLSPRGPSLAAGLLARRCALRVCDAAGGERPRPGTVYLAPPDRHLLVRPGGRLALSTSPKVAFTRPAADPLFISAARAHGERTLALVLSGHGCDSVRGVEAIAAAGGTVLAQSPATCAAPAMPQAAIYTGRVAFALPPAALGAALIAFCMVPGAAQFFVPLPPPCLPDGQRF
ncbi:MAG: chemotaxis protein CheB [Thermomicrobiales bacterium]